MKGDPIQLLEMIKGNSLSFHDKNKADIVIIDAIMNVMTTWQRDIEDLTKYTKHFKVARDLCKEKYRGILKIPTLAQNESHGAAIQKPAPRQQTPVSYPSCILRAWIKQTMVHSSRRWQECLLQVGRMSTQASSRMLNIFCPSTSMIKLIMISKRSNETIVKKVAHPQRMKTILPVGDSLSQRV